MSLTLLIILYLVFFAFPAISLSYSTVNKNITVVYIAIKYVLGNKITEKYPCF